MKKKLMIVFLFFALLIVICLILLYKDQRITVLGYHDFTEGDSVSNMQMNIKKFDKQMKYLKDHNYNTITLKQMDCFINKTCKIPRKSVLITMDDGYKSNYDLAFKVLKKYNFNGVVFYMGVNYNGGNENYMDLNMIKEAKRLILQNGIKIDGEKEKNIDKIIKISNREIVIQKGKKCFIKIRFVK